MKLAVLLPGIGYHKDKPLLYFARKLVQSKGYETIDVEYHDLPQKIKGDKAMMKKAAEIAISQTCEQLENVDFASYEKVLFIGKSIGTVVVAKYVSDYNIEAKQVWYTPVEATFTFGTEDAVAFIGDDDPWSDLSKVKTAAAYTGINLTIYPACNHSLESADVEKNLEFLQDVIHKTAVYIEE